MGPMRLHLFRRDFKYFTTTLKRTRVNYFGWSLLTFMTDPIYPSHMNVSTVIIMTSIKQPAVSNGQQVLVPWQPFYIGSTV